jgi:hypothetical protein
VLILAFRRVDSGRLKAVLNTTPVNNNNRWVTQELTDR